VVSFFLLILLIIFVLTYFVFFKNRVPPSIKKIADGFIISLVGESEFNKDYVMVNNFDNCTGNEPYGCYLKYKFLPGEIYGSDGYLFYYSSEDKKVEIANNNIPIELPSCEKDINKCKFKITRKTLEDIAKKENLNKNSFRLIMKENKILIEISRCNLETEEGRGKVLVDPSSGEIIWRGKNEECQGVV